MPELLHLKLTIAYDGTGLVGWQRQATGTSVQGLLEAALAPLDLDGSPVMVTGAGRTDAGVHALGQVASVAFHRPMSPASVVRAANARLPPAVRVLGAEAVEPDFHARFHAVAKTYRYRIWNTEVLNPFEGPYVWHIAGPRLDVAAMTAAAERLEGRHDFAAFQSTGTDVETTERTIMSSTILSHAEPSRAPLITFDVRGDAFLRHMVRTIVGTLVEVGRGRRPVSWVDEVLASRTRGLAGMTAPAAGLFLVSVDYE